MKHTLESVEEKVRLIIARNLRVDSARIGRTTDLIDDLGADSLDAMTIALDVDREFEIKVKDGDVDMFRTCGDIAAAVIQHLEDQAAVADAAPRNHALQRVATVGSASQ